MATHSSILAWRIPFMRSLVGYSPWGHKELDTAEATEHVSQCRENVRCRKRWIYSIRTWEVNMKYRPISSEVQSSNWSLAIIISPSSISPGVQVCSWISGKPLSSDRGSKALYLNLTSCLSLRPGGRVGLPWGHVKSLGLLQALQALKFQTTSPTVPT